MYPSPSAGLGPSLFPAGALTDARLVLRERGCPTAECISDATDPAPSLHTLLPPLRSGSNARLILRYDEGLSHRIYAGADLILIPSAFEPCGLTQVRGEEEGRGG